MKLSTGPVLENKATNKLDEDEKQRLISIVLKKDQKFL